MNRLLDPHGSFTEEDWRFARLPFGIWVVLAVIVLWLPAITHSFGFFP